MHFAFASAKARERDTRGDALEPGLEGAAFFVPAERFGEAEENVMQHVFGVGSRSGETIRERHERMAVARVQLGERVRTSGSRALGQVSDGLRHCHQSGK